MTNTYQQHSQQHQHSPRERRWTWAHVQQGVRRNCLIGPVAFCLLVILVAPYVLQHDDIGIVVLQRLPLVEAVPFFRRAKAAAFQRRRRRETAVSAVTVSTAVSVSPVTITGGAATSSSTTSSATITRSSPKKRKHSATTEYNFPLFPHQDQFEQDPSAPIPFRYYEAHQQKDDIARQAVRTSLQWRRDHHIDTLLSRPHPHYDIAKRVLPHYFVGRSAVTNHVVFIQRPGLANLPLADHNGVSLQDMLDQYAYVFEYCWNILHTNTQTSPEGDNDLMIGIMDLQGLNLVVIRNRSLINFVKEFVGMIDAHYPTRAYKTYMVNAPGWFSTLYKLISPIMRETTKEKIVLYSAGKKQDAALVQALGPDMATMVQQALRIPDKKEHSNDLSLTSDILLDTDMEQEIRNFVLQRLEQEGMQMKPVVPLPSSQ